MPTSTHRALALFLSLSASAAMAAACAPDRPPEEASQGEGSHAGALHAEGGEAGEGGGLSVTSSQGYATTLRLMQGHLLAGRELLAKGMASEAEPHIAHPIDELYGDLEPELSRRGAPPFLAQLQELKTRLQAAPDAPETAAALDAVDASIEQAIAVLPASERQDPAFVVGVIRELVRTAAEEYDAALADGAFVEVLEYQDSRGFLLVAEQLYQQIEPRLKASDPAQAARLASTLAELRSAWPTILPPERPVLTPEQVRALAQRL